MIVTLSKILPKHFTKIDFLIFNLILFKKLEIRYHIYITTTTWILWDNLSDYLRAIDQQTDSTGKLAIECFKLIDPVDELNKIAYRMRAPLPDYIFSCYTLDYHSCFVRFKEIKEIGKFLIVIWHFLLFSRHEKGNKLFLLTEILLINIFILSKYLILY